MDIKDVENLAALARIELDEDEKVSLLFDMKEILEYVKQIEKVPARPHDVSGAGGEVSDVSPEYNINNVWREDVLEPREFSQDLIIRQFPDKQDGFLKVKKIL